MTPERWEQVKEVLYEALQREPEERSSFIARACEEDVSLRSEVQTLLSSYEQAGSALEKPPRELAMELLAKERLDQLIGQSIGQYRLVSLLGAGGMGEVFLAEDTRLGRKVALKLLPARFTQNTERLRRFQQEARSASALNHPHILTIYDFGRVGSTHYIASEFVEGETLRQLVSRETLPVPTVLEIASQVASALNVAHEAGIVHRDIKPENLMLRRDGYAKVLDFGLAKLTEQRVISSEARTQVNTEAGTVMGTANYMSPEQARGVPLDARTDIWSLGVVIYEMMSGRTPFAEQTVTDTIISVLQKEALPLSQYVRNVPAELERIVQKCLAKDPAQRYQSAEHLASELKNLQRELTSGSQPTLVSPSNRSTATRARVLLAAAVAALLVTALVYILLTRNTSNSFPAFSRPDIKSLAVLPLENLSGDPAQEYFADGMTEAVIANLARISALRVISRTSVMQYKGVHKPLTEIAKELNVDAIIEGSVQRSGDRAQVTVQLIDAKTDRHLWAQTYQRDLRDVLALQSEVAQAVTAEIKITLTPAEQSHMAKTRKVNPEAYDAYLRGKFHFNRYTEADSEKGIQLLERAVALDPDSAESHAALALAYQYKFNNFNPEQKELQEKTFVETQKALGLDPDLADAYIARGRMAWVHATHFRHEDAIHDYQRALSLNPNSDEALLQLGQVYGHIGIFQKAHDYLQKAIAINPANVRARWFIGQTFLYERKYQEAIATSREVSRDLNPHMTGYQIAWAQFQLGQRDAALATLDEYLRDFPEDTPGTLASMQAVIFASAGQRAKAEEKIRVALGKDKDSIQFHHTTYNVGAAYALMNDSGKAIEWLQVSAEDGFPCYSLFETDPNLNNIRQDPRFMALLSTLKQQWERYNATL